MKSTNSMSNNIKRKYYSERNNPRKFTLEDLYNKFVNLYNYYSEKDYFFELAHITVNNLHNKAKYKANMALDFDPFPITEWDKLKLTEDNLFDIIEYLYDNVSKPGDLIDMVGDTGWNYKDYESYDKAIGRKKYRDNINNFLNKYRDGYELSLEGQILTLGSHGIQQILIADLPILGEKNIDDIVKKAILKWRNRSLNIEDRRDAVRDMADVFEWLKKSRMLKDILNKKDEDTIFHIANNFSIRHHNPSQIQNYDKSIWYSWIFHFYLATFHAVSRMINKK